MIEHVLLGTDVACVRRSFGVVLALLSKPRIGKPDRARFDAAGKPPINSLVVRLLFPSVHMQAVDVA
jgi:hypothetical protein